jgi:hypothetical protein
MQLKDEMSELLRFRVNPIFDPVPWPILQYLEKEQLLEVARIQLEYQLAVNEAQGKAMEQVKGMLER